MVESTCTQAGTSVLCVMVVELSFLCEVSCAHTRHGVQKANVASGKPSVITTGKPIFSAAATASSGLDANSHAVTWTISSCTILLGLCVFVETMPSTARVFRITHSHQAGMASMCPNLVVCLGGASGISTVRQMKLALTPSCSAKVPCTLLSKTQQSSMTSRSFNFTPGQDAGMS